MACLRMISTPPCVTRNCPFTRTSYNRSQSFSVCSSIGFEMDKPAQLTTISIPPGACVVINDNDASRLASAKEEFQKTYGKDGFVAELLDVTDAATIRNTYQAAALA